MLHVGSIGGDQKEWTVVEATRHVPEPTDCILGRRLKLRVVADTCLLVLGILLLYGCIHASYRGVAAVQTVAIKLVVPFFIKLMKVLRVDGVRFVVHQLVYFTWWTCLESRPIKHLYPLFFVASWFKGSII